MLQLSNQEKDTKENMETEKAEQLNIRWSLESSFQAEEEAGSFF